MSSLNLTLEEWAEHTHTAANALELMAAIACEIERAYNRDKDCRKCVDLRIRVAILTFVNYGYEDRLGDHQAAMALVRDQKQNICEDCKKRQAERNS